MANLKYKITQATAKQGKNYVKRMVKSQGHSFIEINQEEDIGLDCLIQLYEKEKPNRIISAQIKSGNSFYSPASRLCKIPIENHREYWNNHDFPVLGIVFVPDLYKAFWCDIKKELKLNPESSVIKYIASGINEFNHGGLVNYVTNMGFPLYFYVDQIRKFTKSDNTIKHFLNNVLPQLSNGVNLIFNFENIQTFIRDAGWSFVNYDKIEESKRHCKFSTTSFPYYRGKMTYSRDCKLIYLEPATQDYLNTKLSELKDLLKKY